MFTSLIALPVMAGSREKTDQVVFEAIAKVVEIIVLARCNVLNTSLHPSRSRFNLEVPEVPHVRQIMQRWRRSLHVPLRLDVYWQQASSNPTPPPNSNSNSNTTPVNNRVLLERWSIDYVSLSSAPPHSHPSSSSSSSPDVIAQLRQVCKKVIVALRVIHCFSRIMPAYMIHMSSVEANKYKSSADANPAISQKQGFYKNPPNPSSASASTATSTSTSNGSIGFSFYATSNFDQTTTWNSTTNFISKNFHPIPTPFGLLNLSVEYAKEGLNNSNSIVTSNFSSVSSSNSNPNSNSTSKSPTPPNPRTTIFSSPTPPSNPSNPVADYIIDDYANPDKLKTRNMSENNYPASPPLHPTTNIKSNTSSNLGRRQTMSSADADMSGLARALAADLNFAAGNDNNTNNNNSNEITNGRRPSLGSLPPHPHAHSLSSSPLQHMAFLQRHQHQPHLHSIHQNQQSHHPHPHPNPHLQPGMNPPPLTRNYSKSLDTNNTPGTYMASNAHLFQPQHNQINPNFVNNAQINITNNLGDYGYGYNNVYPNVQPQQQQQHQQHFRSRSRSRTSSGQNSEQQSPTFLSSSPPTHVPTGTGGSSSSSSSNFLLGPSALDSLPASPFTAGVLDDVSVLVSNSFLPGTSADSSMSGVASAGASASR